MSFYVGLLQLADSHRRNVLEERDGRFCLGQTLNMFPVSQSRGLQTVLIVHPQCTSSENQLKLVIKKFLSTPNIHIFIYKLYTCTAVLIICTL